ncbi:MAG: hypothetical protein ABI682_05475 [Acidobacteriota bacterium]
MEPPAERARKRRIVVGAILAVGFSASAVVWIAAGRANPSGYDPNDSKQYLRQMQMYGGTANLLATEIRQGFGSLWHGQRLAGTVAFGTLLLAGAVWFLGATAPPPADAPPAAQGPAANGDSRR